MRKTKYRLEVVLDVRSKKKDEAAQFLAICRQELREAKRELERRKVFLEDCRKQMADARKRMMTEFGDGTSAGNIVAHRDYLGMLKSREQDIIESLEEQSVVIKNAEKAVDDALEKLVDASKELQVIEKHQEKWKKSIKRKANKDEQKLNDEIGAILHQQSDKL